MEWKNVEKSYGSNIQAFTGKYPIFIVIYDICPDDKNKRYKLKCKLPGIKECVGNFTEVGDAKTRAEEIFKYWLMRAELTRASEPTEC